MTDVPRHSPLHARHVALGAKFAAFGGWEMPLEYARGWRGAPRDGGVLAEHAAVREAVGVFDVSHLGKARVAGPAAAEFVNSCLSNDLGKIRPGQAQYTFCCDPATGGVIDDIIAYLYRDDHVFLIANAANTVEVVRRLAAAAPPPVAVVNEHERYAVLAVQGPRSSEVLSTLDLPTGHPYMSFQPATLGGIELTVCRTGYTGEHGYELVVPTSAGPAGPHAGQNAEAVWDAVLEAGQSYGIRPCGLGARDTLRTEMGYPLHGQDLSPQITPVQARAGWAVGWSKPAFWGRDALLAERVAGPRRLLWGLEAVERAIPRPHMAVYLEDDRVGEVTSGTFSPTRKVGIGLALLDTSAGLAADSLVELDVRGRRAAMRVVKPPFVTPAVR
jgi:aminomethyltransferase